MQRIKMRNYLIKLTMFLLCLFVFLPAICFAERSPAFMSEEQRNRIITTFTGDYDEMIEERVIRVLIPHSKTFYFFDGAKPRGISYELAMQFEKYLNKKHDTGNLRIHILVIPTARENLIPHVRDGRGDIAIGNLTITEDRLKEVDFSAPFATGIDEIVVSGSEAPQLKSLFDLGGKKVHT